MFSAEAIEMLHWCRAIYHKELSWSGRCLIARKMAHRQAEHLHIEGESDVAEDMDNRAQKLSAHNIALLQIQPKTLF